MGTPRDQDLQGGLGMASICAKRKNMQNSTLAGSKVLLQSWLLYCSGYAVTLVAQIKQFKGWQVGLANGASELLVDVRASHVS